MSENFEPFAFEAIHDFLHGCLEWENFSVTMQDLKQPSAALVQMLYFNFLQEFGFSNSLLQIPFEVLEDLEHPDIYKDIIPILSLQAACTHLFEKLTGDTSFGISDLINPKPKKTQKFLSVLQNFWLFCNNQYVHVTKVQGEVQKLVKARAQYESKIEEFKNKINQSRSKAVEEKAEEESLMKEIEELKEEFNTLIPKQKELNDIKKSLKEEIENLTQRGECLVKEKLKLETERDNLQGAFEGAAALKKLDMELQEVRQDLRLKEKRKLEFRNNLELLSRWKDDYTAVLELVQQIANEQEKTRILMAKIREQNINIETIKLQREETESEIRELENQVKEKSASLSKLRGQWARRKKGKEEEIAAATADLEHTKLQVGEDHVAAVEISTRKSDIIRMSEEEQAEMAKEAASIRSQYATLLESMEKFNNKLNEDFEKISNATDKLNEGPPAL